MKKNINKISNSEKGDLMIMFAFMFTILVIFLSFAVDLGMMYMQRLKMYEIGHIMRETRFTKNQHITEVYMNSEYPGEKFAQNFVDYARKNGFKGGITVTYREAHPSSIPANRRDYKIDMLLEEKYKTTALGVIGIKEVPISVKIEGSGTREYGYEIWRPVHNKNYLYYNEYFPPIK